MALFTLQIFGQTQIGTSPIYHNNGHVGIGATVPWSEAKLTVENVLATKPSGVNGYYSYLRSNWSKNNAFELGINDGTNWHKLITSSNYHFGSILQFWTVDNERMRIDGNGNVGIGTTSPNSKLEIVTGNTNGISWKYSEAYGESTISNIFDSGSDAGNKMNFNVNTAAGTAKNIMTLRGDGNLGIGVTNPSKKLEVATNTAIGEFRLRPTDGPYQDYRLDIVAAAADIGAVKMSIKDNVFLKTYGYYNLTGLSLGVAGYEDLLHLKNNGNVGIGTTVAPYKLSVEGTIGAREVIVTNDTWPDFVFESNYNLMSLKELDNYIQENKHLPEIPTTAEVEENGISVGKMNAKLLQKIEELTLHTIQQQELIDGQMELINSLKEGMEAQNKRIEQLENK